MVPTLLIRGNMIPPIDADKKLIEKYKKSIPMEIIKEWIKERSPERGGKIAKSPQDRILVVRAKTGSGKSTAMVYELFLLLKPKELKEYRGPGVLCTQPRILTAQEISKDLANSDWAPDLILGKTIGYSTGTGKEQIEGGLVELSMQQ